MEAIISALTKLTESTGLRLYLKGQIPLNTPMPYLVCEVQQPAFGEDGDCTLTAWYAGDDANVKRLAAGEMLGGLFPEGGVMMHMDRGILTLYRGKPFLTLLDGEDERCCAVEGRLVLRWYGGG